jgi:IS5 family transposase
MGPKSPVAQSHELFRQPLCEMLNAKHPLVKLADVIDWEEIECSFSAHFQATTGRPALSPRLVAGLLYLQHAYDCSDEVIVNTWVENPYVQYFTEKTKDRNKLYALHAPEVECISKGKARHPYEFGVKVSVATTLKGGIVVGMRSMPGNPWDGHTLEETLEQVGILNDRQPKVVIVDKGYQGVEVPNTQILRSGQRRGITKTLRKMIKRRSAIEPTIGHMKMDGRLGRNPLKGSLGDALHAVLCGAGHNIRLLLKKLRLLFAQIWQQLIAALFVKTPSLQTA